MSIGAFLTKERQASDRAAFALAAALFLGLGLYHVFQKKWGVAALLGAFGCATAAASALLSERTLRLIGMIAILANVVAAAVTLLAGFKVS